MNGRGDCVDGLVWRTHGGRADRGERPKARSELRWKRSGPLGADGHEDASVGR